MPVDNNNNDARTLADLTWLEQNFQPSRTRPVFDQPVNGTARQRREWKPHLILWTLEWMDALNEIQFRNPPRYSDEEEEEILRLLEEKRRSYVPTEDERRVIDRAAVDELRARGYSVEPRRGRGRHPRPDKSRERAMAASAMNKIRAIWKFHFGKSRNAKLAKEIVAQWIELVHDDEKNKRLPLKEQCSVKTATVDDVEALLNKGGGHRPGARARRR
jgi:hypothetical protein